MQRFRYPLESLLQVRRVREQMAEGALRRAQTRLRKAERRLNQLKEAQETLAIAWREALRNEEEPREVALMAHRWQWLEQQRHLAEQQVAEARAEVERQWNTYRERHREREAVETLRERAWQQWLRQCRQAEQKTLDERALRDFIMRSEEETILPTG